MALLMPSVAELAGVLPYGEVPTHLSFTPQRYFFVRDVPRAPSGVVTRTARCTKDQLGHLVADRTNARS